MVWSLGHFYGQLATLWSKLKSKVSRKNYKPFYCFKKWVFLGQKTAFFNAILGFVVNWSLFFIFSRENKYKYKH